MRQEDIPDLGGTANIAPNDRIIYQRYHRTIRGVSQSALRPSYRVYNWLLAELDRSENLGFGWVCLDDLQSSTWSRIDVEEIVKKGARKDKRWTVLPFPQAQTLCCGYLAPVGTKEHYDW
jgi:hypothetical protein